ncbi:CST complex subunit STN1 [Conger conger]|uniref:CST complex subunit STN1 n=1 Tax=Conger conger TaxID=82655 RepID=UPI002A59EDD6|nr:CST complex subunit STN1 [Conger conger]
MHAEEGDEEPPSMLWGRDPIFSAYARLYIKDILEIKESCQVPGIYFYKLHPIFKVDVLGTVVYKREREDFFCYGVDDGTGVINCLCWKDEQWKDHSGPAHGSKPQVPSHGGFNPTEQLKKLLHSQRCSSNLEIGDVLRVRGPVKTSRGQREIAASSYYKVTDPVLAVQISWMLEVPQLYRKFYDQPCQLSNNALGSNIADTDGGSAASSLLGRASRLLKDFLREKTVEKFRPYDLQQQLVPLVSSTPPQAPNPNPHQAPAPQEPAATQSSSKQLHKLFADTLQLLQDEGLVFRKVISPDQVYQVTEQDRELQRVTREIIREDSKREKYAEKGCHVLHILSSVRQRYSRNVSKAVVEVVLKALECNSEIISATDNHYTAL